MVTTITKRTSTTTKTTTEMIKWFGQIDNLIKGTCPRGDLWIRLDRAGKVNGLYFMFESVYKMVPRDSVEETLEGIKLVAECKLEDWKKAESLNEESKIHTRRNSISGTRI
jgi:hypothetical protein